MCEIVCLCIFASVHAWECVRVYVIMSAGMDTSEDAGADAAMNADTDINADADTDTDTDADADTDTDADTDADASAWAFGAYLTRDTYSWAIAFIPQNKYRQLLEAY